jgi:hypothetical protein
MVQPPQPSSNRSRCGASKSEGGSWAKMHQLPRSVNLVVAHTLVVLPTHRLLSSPTQASPAHTACTIQLTAPKRTLW